MQIYRQGKLRRDFFVFFKKSFSASLIVLMLGMQASYAAITGDSNFNTNVNTNGNITDITGGIINNGTGFHHFGKFELENGHIANMYFGDASRFVNLVDGKVSINGIFNAIKNGGIGGDVVFVSPLGMIVGASGIMNVGSLQTMTPHRNTYDNLVGLGQNIRWDDVKNLKSDSADSSTEIYGKIFAKDKIDIAESRNLTIGRNAGIVSGFNDNGFAKTSVGDLTNIVNTDGVIDSSYMEATSGGIKIVANNIQSDGTQTFMHSAKDVNIDSTSTSTITIDSNIKANGAVNIGNVYSSNSTGDLYLNSNIDAGGQVKLGASYSVNQSEGYNIKASALNIDTAMLSIDGNINTENGIVLKASNRFNQGENSSITNNTSGDIEINSPVGTVVLNKITNQNGSIDISSGDLTFNDTVESKTGSITVTSRGNISQKDDSFDSLKSYGNLNIVTSGNVNVGSASQSLRVNVGGDADVYNNGRASVYLKSVDSDLSVNRVRNGADVKIDSDKKLTIKQNINANKSISLNAADGFSQEQGSAISNTGSGGVTVTNSANGNIELNSIDSGNGQLTVTNNASDSDIILNNNISSNTNIVLNSQGGIQQTTANESLTSGGNIALNAKTDIGSDAQHIVFSKEGEFSANALGGVHLTGENTDISLGNIVAGTDYDIKTTGNGSVIFDKDLTNIKGDLKIETTTALNINSAIRADGDVILKTASGDIILNALITSVNESITLDAQGGIYQDGAFNNTALWAAKNVELIANGDIGSSSSAIQLAAKGVVNVDGGNVYLQSPGSLNIAGINFGKENPDTVVSLKTTSSSDGDITFSGLVKGSDITVDSAQGIYQTSENDKTLEATGVLDLKTANGDIGETGKSIKFSSSSVKADSAGSVVLTGIDSDIRTSQIKSNGNIDLATEVTDNTSNAGNIIVEGDLSTDNGYIRLDSARALDINSNITSSSYIHLRANGGINQSVGKIIDAGYYVTIENFNEGNISLGDVISKMGDINVSNQASGANVILNSVLTATAGSILVQAQNGDLIQNTTQDKASLVAAKDITLIGNEAGSLEKYIVIDAGGRLNGDVNNIYVKNLTGDLTIGEIDAVSNVFLSSEGSILQIDYTKDSIKAGESINLSAKNNIGLNSTDGLSVSGNALVTASAQNIHLASQGALNTGVINAQNDISIKTKSASNGLNINDNITANGNIDISSMGAISHNGGKILKNGSQNGTVNISSNGGNITLKEVTNENGTINITNTGIDNITTLESLIQAVNGDINITTNGDIIQTVKGVSLSTDGVLNINSQNHNIGESGNSITFTANNGVNANSGRGSIYLSALNSDIDTRNIVSGKDIDLAVKGGNLLVTGELITNNGYISLVTDKAIHIEHLISASEYILIDANGAITQDSSLNLALNAGSGDITLKTNGNNIGADGNSLSLNSGGNLNAEGSNIYVKSPNKDLNLNNINSSGTVKVATETTGNLNLNGLVQGSDVTLTAADGIYQNTDGKKISATGALKLIAQKESIGQKNSAINFSAGSVSAIAEKSVVLLGEDTDINTSSISATENIDLSTVVTDPSSDKGKITVANDLTTTNGYIRLDSAKALDINNNISAGQSITLNANGGIIQNSGTSIAAGTASTVTDGSVTVTNKGSGGIILTDVSSNKGNITIANKEGANGNVSLGRINAVDSDIDITNDAQNSNIILNNLVSTNSGSIRLNSQGGIIQDSTYSGISLNSGNDLTLNAKNDLGASSNKLKINAENSLNAKGSNVYLESPSKTLNIANIESSGKVDISTVNDGDINLNGTVSGQDVVLTADKNIRQNLDGQTVAASGSLTLKSLHGDIGATGNPIIFKAAAIAAEALSGSIVLNGIETNIVTNTIKAGNNIDLSTTTSGSITISDAINTNGYIRLNSAEGLSVNNTLSAGSYVELGANNDILLGASITSTGGNIIVDSASGSIIKNNVTALLTAANDITLNAAQNVGSNDNLISIKAGGTLNGTAGNFYVENTEGTLTLGSVNADNTVKLISAGDIVQKTQVSSSITSGGNVYLESRSGDIGKSQSNAMIIDSTGTVNTTSNNLWLASSNDINTGVINADSAVNVITTGSDKNIVIKDKITASDVSLTSSGSIKQDSTLNKTIETNNLTLVAQNGSIGETDNAIDFSASGNLNAAASQAVVLNGFGRDIDTSNISAGTSIDLSTEQSGKIIVSSSLNADNGYIRLNAVDGLELNDSNLTAKEYVTLISQTGDILLNSIIKAGTDITLNAHGSIIQDITGTALTAGNNIQLSAIGDIGSVGQKITLSALGDVSANGANIYLTSPNNDLNLANITTTGGNGTVDLSTISSGNINIKGEITGGNVTLDAYNGIYQTSDEKTITAKGVLSLNAHNNDIGTTDKAIKFESASVNARAPKGSVVLNGIDTDISTSSIVVGKNIDLSTTGTGNIDVAGPLTANGYIKLNSAENLTINQDLNASDYIWLGAQKGINLASTIQAASNVTIDVTGNIIQSRGSVSSTGGDVLVTGKGGAINLNNISAYNDVNINGTGNTSVLITLGNVTAANGNLSAVNTSGGNIVLDSLLTASNGNVSLNANNGNVLQTAATPSIIAGGDVFLGATNVGTSSQYINVSSGGSVSADGVNIYLENNDAEFKVGNINSNTAITNNTVNLKSNSGDIILNGLVKGNNVTVDSAKGVKQRADLAKSVEAGTITFIANNGSVGENGNAIDMSVSGSVNVNKADSVYLNGVDTSSDLNLGTITADNLVQITSAGGLKLNGLINSSTANLSARTNITQNNSLTDGLSIIADTIYLASSSGSIGEQNNAIGFKTNNLSASAVNGSVVLNGIESNINSNSIRAGKNIDLSTTTSGNIIISEAMSTTNGYIRLNSAESLDVNANLTASGEITLNAQDGSVSMANSSINGSSVSVTATNGITQQNGSITANKDISILNKGSDNSGITLSALSASGGSVNITNESSGKVLLNDSINGYYVNITSHGGIEQTQKAGNEIEATSNINIANNGSGDIKLNDITARRGAVTVTGTDAGSVKTGNIKALNSITVTNSQGSNGTVELGALTKANTTSSNPLTINVSNLSDGGVFLNGDVSGSVINIISEGGITQNNGNIANDGRNNIITIKNSEIGDINLNNVTSSLGSINIENSGNGGIKVDDITAAYNIAINQSNTTANKDISVGKVTSNSTRNDNPIVIMNSSGGDILLNGLVSTKRDSAITINAGNGGIYQNISSLGINTSGTLTLSGLGGIGTDANFLKVNAGNVKLTGTDIYLEGTNSNLLISSIDNASNGGIYNIRTTGSGSLTINDDISADNVILNSAASLTTNNNITAQNGSVEITASNGNIALNGNISSTNSDVVISNNSTGNNSVTVNNINAGASYNILNRGNGLVTVNGTLTNGENSSIISSNGVNSGIVLSDSAVLNNNNGTLNIENYGQKGISLDGTINNNINDSTVVNVVNTNGGLVVNANINNGSTEGSNNIVTLNNSGNDGLNILSGLINNYGTLTVENSNGEMSLNGALDAQLGSVNQFVNSSDSDFVVGMKLANYGNTITFENKKTGSLIVSDDAEISVFSTQKDGNVYTGVLNLINSSSDGTNGGGVTINGKINNGSASESGGIVNITNSGNGSSGDYGITIGESAIINNYSEMNIENLSNNGLASGKIKVNGTIKGDKGPVVSGSSSVPVPSGSIINIKNNVSDTNSEIVFGSSANVDVKGNKLNIINDGGKGITLAQGARVSNSDTVTVTNNKGSFNIEKTSSLNSTGSVVVSNKEAANSVNIKGNLKGSNVELNSNASNVNIDGTVEGTNITINADNADVNIAHNSSIANIKANNNVDINVTNGNILNHSDTETSIANGAGISAGGNLTLSADNIGSLDSSLDNILDNGFNLDSTKSINISAGGTVNAASNNVLNLNAVSGNMNLGTVHATNAILSALNGSIFGNDVSASNNMYLYAKADTGSVKINNISTGGKLYAEAGSDITLNSSEGLDIETMLSRRGNINLETNGNTEIREIAAANDINIKVNDEKLTIIDLGRVKRNKNVIPKNVNITVNDAKNPDKTTANGKLDIYNAYVQNKATLKADTITAQVYDISDTAQKGQKRTDKYGNEATGFHNANREGGLLEFDIQGANYDQPDAGSDPNNQFYKPDAADKHALDVYITLGDSVDGAAYGANFKKLYSDRAFVDSINVSDPSAHSRIVLESGIIGEKAIFRNNKLRLDIDNSDITQTYPIDIHYDDTPDEIVNNKTSFNMEMYDKIELNKEPVPVKPDVPEDVEHYNPNRIVNTPDYNKDISNVNRNDVNVVKKVQSKDKENSITASDESTGLRNISWVIRNKDNQILGASEFVAKPVINKLVGISKKGIKVAADNISDALSVKKGDVLHIDMKYKDIAFNTDGKVVKIKDNVAEVRFLNPDKLTESIINFLKMYNEDL